MHIVLGCIPTSVPNGVFDSQIQIAKRDCEIHMVLLFGCGFDDDLIIAQIFGVCKTKIFYRLSIAKKELLWYDFFEDAMESR